MLLQALCLKEMLQLLLGNSALATASLSQAQAWAATALPNTRKLCHVAAWMHPWLLMQVLLASKMRCSCCCATAPLQLHQSHSLVAVVTWILLSTLITGHNVNGQSSGCGNSSVCCRSQQCKHMIAVALQDISSAGCLGNRHSPERLLSLHDRVTWDGGKEDGERQVDALNLKVIYCSVLDNMSMKVYLAPQLVIGCNTSRTSCQAVLAAQCAELGHALHAVPGQQPPIEPRSAELEL